MSLKKEEKPTEDILRARNQPADTGGLENIMLLIKNLVK
jgi:hypothetical protein